MALGWTTFGFQRVIEHSLGDTDIGALADGFLTVLTANPGIAGSVASEAAWSGFARQNISGIFVPDGKLYVNSALVTFGIPQSVLSLAYIGYMTHVSAGDMWAFEQIPVRDTVAGGAPVEFPPGALKIRG